MRISKGPNNGPTKINNSPYPDWKVNAAHRMAIKAIADWKRAGSIGAPPPISHEAYIDQVTWPPPGMRFRPRRGYVPGALRDN